MDTEEAEADAALSYQPLCLLAKVKEKVGSKTAPDRPERLPMSRLMMVPALFQPRHGMNEGRMDERHIGDLERALKAKGQNGDLDPILVVMAGDEAIIIDGHHRAAAYKLSKRNDMPVSYFNGSVEQAILVAGRINSKAKLPMTNYERQNFAWRLVLLGHYSKKQIRESAGVSDGQVAQMRRMKTALGNDAYDARNWQHAVMMTKKQNLETMSDDEREAWLDDKAAEVAEKLSKTFGRSLTQSPDVAARALAAYFGRHLPELCQKLDGHLPEDDEEEDHDEF
ncbi:ParB domain protein nuclease [Rhodomicrobium vannielii ATCC 17100]|uniref:ParB domain protein nuclease n=1 Tax=Rhodomicrobium vannielii (strain ATCC 17100 / DSM 162 / LMG 4299 / NCIMB 10020 / ATH 3.1.1) TaxID=648757 RepID=E3I123_RHOVT|nr:ParB N-terminal domain-containing protein [Rhodomicrobium vannielii]ADP72346.1 ParB domain protein nuclease [Rhodomicrobium vannielii ATCC 17100]